MTPTTDADRAKMMDRIRALLAQAESTTYEAEAQTFMAKAHALMDKYRIALAEVRDDPRTTAYVRHTYPLYQCKYLRASLELFVAVARHYAVVVTVESTGNSKNPYMMGDRDDIEATMLMFGSLVRQRDRFVLSTPVPGGMSTARFRNSFGYGYAHRVSIRLRAIRHAATEAARAEAAATGGNSTALAVLDRLPVLESYLRDAGILGGGHVSHSKPTINAAGYAHGHAAGNRADLGQDRIDRTGPAALTQGDRAR